MAFGLDREGPMGSGAHGLRDGAKCTPPQAVRDPIAQVHAMGPDSPSACHGAR